MERIINGVKLIVKDPKEHQQKYWMNGMFYEGHGKGLLAYLGRHKGKYKGRFCIDIGASIGNHSLYFAKVMGCPIIAIEPVKESYDHLRENLKLNEIFAITFNVALGAEEGMVDMVNASKNKYNAGMYQVRPGDTVQMKRLDDIVTRTQAGLIKIDVEHYNEPVLKGMRDFLVFQRDCDVFIECEDPDTLKITDRIMNKYGYHRIKHFKVNHTPTYLWRK